LKRQPQLFANSQAGYTLVEVMISAAIGAVLLGALVSVVFTAYRAVGVATSRVEASSQIRSFQSFAYTDFARSDASKLSSACTPSSPCATQPISLDGTQVSNSSPLVATPHFQIDYTWDSTNNLLERQVVGSAASVNAATNVTKFQWYVDTDSTVVVSLTVTFGSYDESQTFRFWPRMNP
jgi:prepilin-type N-terminal cleavage/methylation domain-containing protein